MTYGHLIKGVHCHHQEDTQLITYLVCNKFDELSTAKPQIPLEIGPISGGHKMAARSCLCPCVSAPRLVMWNTAGGRGIQAENLFLP